MSLVEPYAPCPCGSGQKYKWCCQKVEPYAERAQRLLENGQFESALVPLQEGLVKVPDSPSLLTRKAITHIQLEQLDQAKEALRTLFEKRPGHVGGAALLVRLLVETDGPVAAAGQFQQVLSAARPEDRPLLASTAAVVGVALQRGDFPAAAIKHLELAARLDREETQRRNGTLQSIKASPEYSVWEKNPYQLWEAPAVATPEYRDSLRRAITWADEGLWASAASAFELLSAGSGAGAVADRNRGLCLLWIADHEGAVAALKRYIARSTPTTDAVELEVLCQRIGKVPPRDLVELVQLKWGLRNREGLLAALRRDDSIDQFTTRPLDPTDPDSPDVLCFLLLDRPRAPAREGLTRRDIPFVQGEVLVNEDSVYLETFDDGRLDRLTDRFTTLAGSNIPPAHPRTRMVRKEPRYQIALSWRWSVPEGLSELEKSRLDREQLVYILTEVWPQTPHPFLRWRTPLQAAKAGDAEISLRAALLLLEESADRASGMLDWNELRSKLGVRPEPAAVPEQLDKGAIHIGRLASLPIDDLDDDRLIALYKRAREWGVGAAAEAAAVKLAARPSLLIKGEIEPLTLYGDLARYAALRQDRPQVESWLARGQESEPPRARSAHAIGWKMLELEVDMMLDGPELWVPKLTGILEKYCTTQEGTSAVFSRLIQLGLVQLRQDPNNPEQAMVDTRLLAGLFERYGPKVVVPPGTGPDAASRGEIWTPGAGGGAAPIWTPGSSSPPGPGRESGKIILPGQ